MAQIQIRCRISDKTQMLLHYWPDALGVSRDEFIADAIDAYVRLKAGDFREPALYISRQNQILDSLENMTQEVRILKDSIHYMSSSLSALVSGDDYLGE